MPKTDGGLKGLAAKLRSPQYRSDAIARHAKREIARLHKENEAALETKLTQPRITVDGRRGAPLRSVKPDGKIVAEWNFEFEVVRWVLDELRRASPSLTGKYEKSHTLLIDGVEHSGDGAIPLAGEYIIYSPLPYARRIERGSSKQAPDGVYQVVAALALRRFGKEALVYFGYRAAEELGGASPKPRGKRGALFAARDNRVPAIFIHSVQRWK